MRFLRERSMSLTIILFEYGYRTSKCLRLSPFVFIYSVSVANFNRFIVNFLRWVSLSVNSRTKNSLSSLSIAYDEADRDWNQLCIEVHLERPVGCTDIMADVFIVSLGDILDEQKSFLWGFSRRPQSH